MMPPDEAFSGSAEAVGNSPSVQGLASRQRHSVIAIGQFTAASRRHHK